MTAQILPFPNRRTCYGCIHYDPLMSRCQMFDEVIVNEVQAAKDCNAFEVDI